MCDLFMSNKTNSLLKETYSPINDLFNKISGERKIRRSFLPSPTVLFKSWDLFRDITVTRGLSLVLYLFFMKYCLSYYVRCIFPIYCKFIYTNDNYMTKYFSVCVEVSFSPFCK